MVFTTFRVYERFFSFCAYFCASCCSLKSSHLYISLHLRESHSQKLGVVSYCTCLRLFSPRLFESEVYKCPRDPGTWCAEKLKKKNENRENHIKEICVALFWGILWHQGETDASILDKDHHAKYRSMLLEILQKFRERLEKPNLPIICGEIAKFVSSCTKRPFPHVSEINNIIREVCQVARFCISVCKLFRIKNGGKLSISLPKSNFGGNFRSKWCIFKWA